MIYLFPATKGRGVHTLKAGSKRRRTQAQMRDQYEMEQVMDVVNQENESKVKEQSDRIQNLEQQLNSLSQEAS